MTKTEQELRLWEKAEAVVKLARQNLPADIADEIEEFYSAGEIEAVLYFGDKHFPNQGFDIDVLMA